MSRLTVPIVVVVIVGAGAWYALRPQKQTLGGSPASEALQTTNIGTLNQDMAGRTVQIEGTIAEECPHTGCWAVIQDDTGRIRIDTNKGGFALPLNREGSKIRVVGTLEVKENGDLEISASSAEL
jgi:RecJ-like exonuclease